MTNVKAMLRGFPEESSTEAEYKRLESFLDSHRADLGSAVDTVKQGLDKMAANIKWRNRFLGQVQDWLARERKGEEEGEERGEGEEKKRGEEEGNYFEDFVTGRLLCPVDILGLFCD